MPALNWFFRLAKSIPVGAGGPRDVVASIKAARHELETMYRILSFMVLGIMLVSLSWAYTRFRDRIQRYL